VYVQTVDFSLYDVKKIKILQHILDAMNVKKHLIKEDVVHRVLYHSTKKIKIFC